MKKITSRTLVCLLLSLFLALGMGLFVYRFFTQGGDWAAFPANRHLYTDGVLNCGRILDRNGNILAAYNDGWNFNEDENIRTATLHTVGDPKGVIGAGALSQFADKLTGYNLLTGSNTVFPGGNDLYLTIDANLCATAFEGLKGHSGTVAVYNYKTGELICMVSSPSYDPQIEIDPEAEENDGVFINRFTTAKFVPGSTFKLITATAALENIPDIESRTFECSGSVEIGGYKVTCSKKHGSLNFEDALNVSCNCTFGQLAVEMGADVMNKYVKSTGLTNSYSINGISTMKSSFDFSSEGDAGLAWSGVGQGKDLVNPCSLMVFAGAVANGGTTAVPQIINYTAFHEGVQNSIYIEHNTETLIDPSTAVILKSMMRTDVLNNYGQKNFPDLEICAKSGTAQLDTTENDNAWFVGFLDDPNHPLAFIVMVEGGGSGASTAGKLANTVLQEAVKNGY